MLQKMTKKITVTNFVNILISLIVLLLNKTLFKYNNE